MTFVDIMKKYCHIYLFRVFHKVALISPLKDVHEDYLVSLEESTKT